MKAHLPQVPPFLSVGFHELSSLPPLSLELVLQLVSFGGIAVMPREIAVLSGGIAVMPREIAVLSGEIAEALGRHLVKPQAVSGDLWLLFQHPAASGLVLAVIELLGGPVDQLLALELLSVACQPSSLSFSALTPAGCCHPHPPGPIL